ncbi:TA system VapC family ribonuclease toxin [Methyloceanibacter sp.]|uniref:TA system VapC family ribonuclease toxin n=1 Tax=Methyloceanibacter sp. TaxID=1965321 RepID=UPI002D2558EF|nr:TA system VapC family ribonuclease toxin [Methyloceanibacter sp.]HZP10294.1 TA system VapC family ribonuclease toxin [Methyloceanibacter sp.]
MRALLDVSVLLSLFDRGHIQHQRATAWSAQNALAGWASCPLTHNGFVRIVSQPGYPRPARIIDALTVLRRQMEGLDYVFWPHDISIADETIFDRGYILGPNQIADVYLLALAVRNGGRLVTFDRGLPLRAVRGAEPRHLVVLRPRRHDGRDNGRMQQWRWTNGAAPP